ncbi:MAG: alpha-L-fucosidase, partial [Phycisphaerae bacterium]|nr:alpha-L-fucosidase [Phycisphaerae bacterium]
AKHHDGFSMYRSQVDQYNAIDASHFSVDPVEVLSQACRKRGIKFCIYYSQDQDWHHPHGTGNDWDYDEQKKNFSTYFEEKVKPQITELLTKLWSHRHDLV